MTTAFRLFRASPVLRQSLRPTVPARQSKHSPKNPLVKAAEFQGKAHGRIRGAENRVDVISDNLCNDALDLLGPSLSQFKGCDIVDFFPGTGLWSSKVHDLLQPYSHTLVETQEDDFEALLNPLLDRKSSRYRYMKVATSAARKGRELIDRDFSKYLSPPKDGTIESTSAARPLLVLATLTAITHAVIKKKATKGKRESDLDTRIPRSRSPSEEFIFEFLRYASKRGETQRQLQPIRLLVWMHDGDKLNFLPRAISNRTTSIIELDEAFRLREIVGSSRTPSDRPYDERNAKPKLQSALRVGQIMKSSGRNIPRNRTPPLQKVLEKWINTEHSATPVKHEPHASGLERKIEELDNLQIKWAFGVLDRDPPDDGKGTGVAPSQSEASTIIVDLANELDTIAGVAKSPMTARRNRAYWHLKLLYELEMSIALKTPTHPLIEQAADAPGGFIFRPPTQDGNRSAPLTIVDLLNLAPVPPPGLKERTLYMAQTMLDNDLALNRTSPLLAWDRRTFEPLETQAQDFYPKHKLALLDFEVSPDFPARITLPSGTRSGSISRIPLVRRLRQTGASSIAASLNTIAHGCADALIPECPSMTDTLRGGRSHVEHLRGRMLTLEMWRELAEAWYKWPFRRSDEELEGQLGQVIKSRRWDNVR